MSLVTWPSRLPRPSRSGLEQTWQDPRLRKGADAGPPGYRRRYSAVAKGVSLDIRIYRAELAVFAKFYDTTVDNGTVPFWMPDPMTDGWAMLGDSGAPVLTETGLPLLLSAQWLCLFGEDAPSVKPDGLRFRVSFSVWVMP